MDERSTRQQKAAHLRAVGPNPYPHRFDRTHSIAEARQLWAQPSGEGAAEARGPRVTVAGRLQAVRRMGKASFAQLEDQDARIQVHLAADKTQGYDLFKEAVDRGDIVGVSGPLFYTKTGELTVSVESLTLLAKAIQPLPEKFHGLRDLELMRRQRYLHLIMDMEARQLFRKRSKLFAFVRAFLAERGFMEVQTPILQPLYGGASARPFVTHHNELKRDLFLRIAPELYLKRLVVGGFEKVFEIAPAFRNEGIDSTHNPEFTILELYSAYVDYTDIMTLTEGLYRSAAVALNGTAKLPARKVHDQEAMVDLASAWRRLPMHQAVEEYAGIHITPDTSDQDARRAVSGTGLKPVGLDQMTADEITVYLFEEKVEPRLVEPTFIMDFPASLCPLTKQHRDNPKLAERFELFMAGMECANAYSELTDPFYQAQQFANRRRAMDGEEPPPIDDDYINALEYGLPPTGGLGIGLDRMLMLLIGAVSIRDVILFPLQRQAAAEGAQEEPQA